MKLLFVPSGHPLMEADLCLMWERLGIDWVSTGYYSRSEKPGDLPYINSLKNQNLLADLDKQFPSTLSADMPHQIIGQKNLQWTGQVIKNRFRFTPEFLKPFDAILCTYLVENILDNLDVLRNKRLFLYTFGMHSIETEPVLRHLKDNYNLVVVRNSAAEKFRPGADAADDTIIRGCVVKDDIEISGWNGQKSAVCTFSSFMNLPSRECQQRRKYYTDTIKHVTKECHLFGVNSGTFLNHEDKIQTLRNYRANLVVGTPGANNTYSFVEAWVMGQPVVVFGQKMWQSQSYEPSMLIEHGVNGFIGDSPAECAKYLNLLLQDYELAKKIGAAGRASALEYYNRDLLAAKWRVLFKQQGLL